MSNLPRYLIITLIIGSIVWQTFQGCWESSYSDSNSTYLISIDNTPIWSSPAIPNTDFFASRFGDFDASSEGETSVIHRWDYWIERLLFKFLIISLISAPLIFLLSHDIFLGVVARIGSGLILGALGSITLWFIFGGWGAPFTLLFGVLGFLTGAIWGFLYYVTIQKRKTQIDSITSGGIQHTTQRPQMES